MLSSTLSFVVLVCVLLGLTRGRALVDLKLRVLSKLAFSLRSSSALALPEASLTTFLRVDRPWCSVACGPHIRGAGPAAASTKAERGAEENLGPCWVRAHRTVALLVRIRLATFSKVPLLTRVQLPFRLDSLNSWLVKPDIKPSLP